MRSRNWSFLGALVLVVAVVLYFGLLRHFPVEQAATNRLHAEAKGNFEDQVAKAEKLKSFESRSRATEEARIELKHNQELADGHFQNCPANPYDNGKDYFRFDQGSCKAGQRIQLILDDVMLDGVYELHYLDRSKDNNCQGDDCWISVSANPKLQSIRGGKIQELGNGQFEIHGRAAVIYEGFGDRLEGRKLR